MKIIKITESQYKKLVKTKNLNEQFETVYKDESDKFDITVPIQSFINWITDQIGIMYNKNLFIDKILDGVVYIDWENYSEDEKNSIESLINDWVGYTSDSNDELVSGNYFSGLDWDYEEDYTPEKLCWCNDIDGNEIEYLCVDGLPNNCVVDVEDTDDIVKGNCNLTEEEQQLFDSTIFDFKTANNFRWWIHQDKDRLEKVEKKLKSCGLSPELYIVCKWTVGIESPIGDTFFENQYMTRYGNYLKIPFKLYGSDWVNSGSVRPKSTYKNSNGNLSDNDLVAIQDDVSSNREYLHKDAVDSWNKMVLSAKTDGIDLTISDAYRPCGEPGDYERYLNKEVRFTQWAAWRKWDYRSGKAAEPKPNTEEKWIKKGGGKCKSHHGFKGAVDISNGKRWMEKNAPKFGWCKYKGESWHWDYYGDDIDNKLSSDKVNCK